MFEKENFKRISKEKRIQIEEYYNKQVRNGKIKELKGSKNIQSSGFSQVSLAERKRLDRYIRIMGQPDNSETLLAKRIFNKILEEEDRAWFWLVRQYYKDKEFLITGINEILWDSTLENIIPKLELEETGDFEQDNFQRKIQERWRYIYANSWMLLDKSSILYLNQELNVILRPHFDVPLIQKVAKQIAINDLNRENDPEFYRLFTDSVDLQNDEESRNQIYLDYLANKIKENDWESQLIDGQQDYQFADVSKELSII